MRTKVDTGAHALQGVSSRGASVPVLTSSRHTACVSHIVPLTTAAPPQACLNMLIDEELAKEKGQGSGEAGNKGAIVAAVLVPAVVLGKVAPATGRCDVL